MSTNPLDLEACDWSATPLGPRENWRPALEAIFTMMLASPFAMCATWGPEQTLLYNAAYVPFLGKRHPAALGQPIATVWSDVWTEIGPIIARVLKGESVSFTDLHLVMTRNGYDEDTWWTFAYSPLRDDGQVVGMIDIAMETTSGVVAAQQRDAVEAELRARNVALEQEVAARTEAGNRFATLVQHLPVGVCLFDSDGRALLSSPLYRQLLPDQPIPSRMTNPEEAERWLCFDAHGERLPPDRYPGARALRGELVTPGVEFLHRRVDGSETWFAVSGVPLMGGAGHVMGAIVMLNDIDHRKRALEAARIDAERVQLALSAGAIMGTWFWDIPTDRFTVDEAFATTFGLDPALGREGISLAQVVETVHPDDQAGLAKAIEEAIAQGSRYAHQYRVRRRDGRYYWIEANGRVDRDADGTPRCFSGVLIDVDERRTIEAERDRAIAELRALNDTLEQRVAERSAELMQAEEKLRQSQKMEAVGQLTGGMAHDFNNLLQAMSGCLQLIGRRAGHVAGVQKVLDSGHQAVDRGASMIRQLMAFSRRQSLQPEAFDVRDRLLGMRAFLDRALRADIRLEFDLESGLWPAMADPVQFELALLNLATNARDAMTGAGQLVIGAGNRERTGQDGVQEAFVRVWVRDSGRGIAPATLDRVFEPFFTTKAVGQGTGLGLAQVYGFCQQSGGTATVESVEGQGTTVTLLLPRAGTVPAVAVDARPAMVDGGGASVLLVEDDPVVALVIVAALEELGYRVSRAANGEEALRRLRDGETADLLFSDVVMPGEVDGLALAEAARALLPDLAVVLTTGYSENRAGLKGFPVLSKPYRIEDLALTLREEIDRSARNQSCPMGFTFPCLKIG
ncbi:PAS domain S-box protein [Azospirillum doebereinerae]|uniref:histidine kinase n=1 Tax=Azospirillum doebereinerae TaxID=92933 RepID=A0A433IZN6_9PROT|nr:PAS domain S-box protein [Azospirillum doebereinerae]RUQ60898.1 PAS domain S-box protein [Azospirillum doebereinerae]